MATRPRSASKRTAFKGEIRVTSRIIDYLSSGLYPSPAACLKELINNSYDADSLTVQVFVKPEANRIVIHDDGDGMSRKEFQTHFERVSESHKRDKGQVTSLGRPKIGKIGIGFIAANELCEVLEIFSTKAGSGQLMHVTIDFSKLGGPLKARRRKKGELMKADYVGELLEADESQHYTTIVLSQVRESVRGVLAGASPQRADASARSLYGSTPDQVVDALTNPVPGSWKDFDQYSETMLHVALNVPVRYAPGWIPAKFRENITVMEATVDGLQFDVQYDGTELRKPILLRPPRTQALCIPFKFAGEKVSANGYFFVQHGVVKPKELQGLLIRIRHAAVGEYDPSFMGFPGTESQLIQRWVSAEILADDRLEAAMNIDRRTLRTTEAAYVELRNAVHKEFRGVLRRAKRDLYELGSEERKQTRADEMYERVLQVASDTLGVAFGAVYKDFVQEFRSRARTEGGKSALARTYTAADIVAIVADVIAGEVPPRTAKRLLARFAERLTR